MCDHDCLGIYDDDDLYAEDELRAWELARLRAGVDPDEPVTIELVERVAVAECGAVCRQIDLLEREAPDDLEWGKAIVERLAWACRFASIAGEARHETA